MDKKVLENNQSLRNKRKQNFPQRVVSKVKDRPKHACDDDYCARIKPYYNGQGHIAQKGKNICEVLLHIKKARKTFMILTYLTVLNNSHTEHFSF